MKDGMISGVSSYKSKVRSLIKSVSTLIPKFVYRILSN